MSNSEFKARALYDFVAEGPNELTFKANDILTITSNTAGHGWWYAKNSSGKVGVIPENYVQALADPPEPNEPPPPLSTFTNAYPTLDAFGSNNNGSRTSYPPPYDQHQYMNPSTFNNWQPQETSAWPSSPPPPPNQLTEQRLDPSLQSINFYTEKPSTYTLPLTSKPYDGYITIEDVSPTANGASFANPNLPTERYSVNDHYDDWYSILPKTPAPILSKSNQSPFDPTFLFDFPQQQQQTSTSDGYLPPIPTPSPQTVSNYQSNDDDTTSSNPSADIPTPSQLIPAASSESINKFSSSPMELESVASRNRSISSVSKTSKKRRLPNFLSLTHKQKSEQKKNQTDEEPSRQSNRKDTDSDDSFSDSEYPAQSSQITNSNALPSNPTSLSQTRTSLATAEASKGPPRARFFDKHGVDNYLLNGSKAKVEEHVEITFNEREGGVCWSPNPGIPPFSCKVEDPSKGTKLGGLKAFMEYKIHPQVSGSRVVGRRYKQFDWLHEQLANKFRFICIPPLPGKQIAGRFEQEFIEERRRQLELWLNRICRHPVLCASFPVQHFITCELTDKNKKDWKTGKRKIEKDEAREASWLQCVTIINSGLSDPLITSQIDTFGQQQPGLETQFKNLSQGFTKYIERQTEVYERDLQRISELFSKVHLAVQVDTTTPGNRELSSSIHKTSGSYGGIAELYKTKASDGLRDFNERIQEYIGLLACFPSILSIQRSASEFMKTNQQRGTADFSNAVYRHHILNHVVLAEINFFQKEKVTDLNVYLKTLVDEQIQFYEKVTTELRDASITYK